MKIIPLKLLFRTPSRSRLTGLAWLLMPAVFAVSAMAGQPQGKDQGVYTTLYTPETAPLASFDMPGSTYFEYDNFGPDEIPFAVIRGYDGNMVTFELIDLTATNEILVSKARYQPPGRVSCEALLIRRTGEYEVRILLNGKERDTFKFSVVREPLRASDGRVNYDAVIAIANEQLKFNSFNAVAYDTRAAAHAGKGELDAAIADYTEALRLRPYDASAHVLRALLYSRKKMWDEAIGDANEFIRLQPDDPRGPYTRAIFYKGRGDFDKELADLRSAVRMLPTYARAENELAWLLATCPRAELRNGKESVELATKVCETSQWKKSGVIDTLASGYAESGDFTSAIKYEKQALDGPDVPAARKPAYQQRLQLYERDQPYHQSGN